MSSVLSLPLSSLLILKDDSVKAAACFDDLAKVIKRVIAVVKRLRCVEIV